MVHRILPFLLLTATAGSEGPGTRAAAVAYSVEGSVAVQSPTGATHEVLRFEWIEEGAVVSVSAGGRVRLALATGSRFELSEGVRATVGPKGLVLHAGAAKTLPTVPAFAEVAPPIVRGGVPGAVRIRRREIDGLQPAEGTLVPRGSVEVRFVAPAGLEGAALEVQDADGRLVFESEIRGSPVTIPGAALTRGGAYAWCVTGKGLGGFRAQGCSSFESLSQEAEARLTMMVDQLSKGTDAADAALSEEVSRRVGFAVADGDVSGTVAR